MIRFATILGLAGALALSASLRADDIALSGNPYTTAVERNIFGLNPPVAVDATPATPAEPPPKITPNGITDILGQLEVLFKVSGATPGKEDSYILTEGESQDDIEVTKIDKKNSIVTFNNHGVVQEIPLASSSGGSSAGGGNHGFATGGNSLGAGFANRFGNRIGNYGGNPVNYPGSANNGLNPPPMPTPASPSPTDQPPPITPEEQVVGIEINREMTKQQVLEGTMPPLPPTEMTPPDATGAGGGPLVIAPPDSTPDTPQ
jgi:hypothetical protein